MLAKAQKVELATIFSMMKLTQNQLKRLNVAANHEKIEQAIEHLGNCLAELEDCVLETR